MLPKKSKSSDKQNVELFKFFETPKKEKTSPRGKKTPSPISIKLPQRRTTRLKSEIFVESYPQVLPDGEYDISKEDFNTTLEPLTRENRSFSSSNNSSPTGELCEKPKKQSKLTKMFERLETIVASYTKSDKDKTDGSIENGENNKDSQKLEKSNKRKKNLKTNEETDMIESIDVNAIADMLKDTSFEKDNYEKENASITTKKKKKRKLSENSEQNDNEPQKDNDFDNQAAKKAKTIANAENNEDKLNKKSKSKDKIKHKDRDCLQNNTDHSLYDDNPQLSLTVSDEDDEHIESMPKIEIEKSNKKSTKKKRKSSLEDNLKSSSEEANNLCDNNPNLALNVNGETKTGERKAKKRNNSLNEIKATSECDDIDHKENNDEVDSRQPKSSVNEDEKSGKKSKKRKNENHHDLPSSTISPIYELMESNDEKENNDICDDNNVNPENSLETSLIGPKKRGRKPKNFNSSLNEKNTSPLPLSRDDIEKNDENDRNSNNYSCNDNINHENSLETSLVEPKKRGRKPKNLNSSLNEKITSPLPLVRDNKEKNYENDRNSDHDSCNDNINHENSLDTSLVEPKKRGRKPKNLNSSLNEKNPSPIPLGTDENDAKQPKKRGRKPKTLNDTQTDKNTSTKANGILKYFTVTEKKSVNTDTIPNEHLEADTQISANENSATISEERITRSRRSNNLNTTNTSAKSDLDKSANIKGPKKNLVNKLNKPQELKNQKKTKMHKLTKDQIKQGANRKIPKKRLDEILEMVEDEDHPYWEDRNISCNTAIHTYWETRHVKSSEHNMKIKYARQFLLRRDWINLSKVLSLHNSELTYYYPLLSKYATILMAHTDSEQFDKLIQYLTSITDSKAVIKKCTKISKHNED